MSPARDRDDDLQLHFLLGKRNGTQEGIIELAALMRDELDRGRMTAYRRQLITHFDDQLARLTSVAEEINRMEKIFKDATRKK